jgi:hypothetical protein
MTDDAFNELAGNYNVGNELLAAMRQAEQQLTSAWMATNPEDGSYGPGDLQIMAEAWVKLNPEQQEKALRHDLFGAYRHHVRDLQERHDIMTMAKLDGSSFLDGDDSDLDVIAWAGVMTYDLNADSTVEVCKMRDALDLPENGLPQAYVPVPVDTLWRLVQEVQLLRFRDQTSKQAAA